MRVTMLIKLIILPIFLAVLPIMVPHAMAWPYVEEFPDCSAEINHADAGTSGALQNIIKGRFEPVNVTFRKDCVYTFGMDEVHTKSSRVIPANVRLKFEEGAIIKTGVGFTLEIRGPIEAENHQIFDVESNISLSQGSVTNAPFEWWGAKGDGVNDDGPAIEKAAKISQSVHGTPGAVYLVETPINLDTHRNIDGRLSSIIGPQNNSCESIFVVTDKKWVKIRNFEKVDLNKAKSFVYILGASFVDVENVRINARNPEADYRCIDIYNSYHCTLTGLTIEGAGPAGSNDTAGIFIRSKAVDENGQPVPGYGVVDNILIKGSNIRAFGTGVLLDFDNQSNNIRIERTTIEGHLETDTGGDSETFGYGIRSTGSSRTDFISLNDVTLQLLKRGISFELPLRGYTLSIKDSQFISIDEVFYLEGSASDKVNFEQVQITDCRSIFHKLDASVTLMNAGQTAWYTEQVQKDLMNQAGSVIPYPNDTYRVIQLRGHSDESEPFFEIREVFLTTTEKKTKDFFEDNFGPENQLLVRTYDKWWWLYSENHKVDLAGSTEDPHVYNWYGVEIDREPVDGYLSIGSPSADITRTEPITYTISYIGAATLNLDPERPEEYIELIPTNTARGKLEVGDSGTDPGSRTVTVYDISGDGTLAISLKEGSAVDSEGNPAPKTGPSEPFLVDNTPPTASISRAVPTAESTSAATVTYMVSFSEAVTGVTKDNFNVSAAGITGASILYFMEETGNTWTVMIDTGSGDGTLGLEMVNSTGVSDAAGNAIASLPLIGQTYIIDKTAPTLVIGAPSSSITRGGPVSFTISYTGAEGVTLTSADVSLNKTGTAAATISVSETDTTTRTVTLSGITGDGTLAISLAPGTAADAVGNSAAAAGPSAIFTVDNTAPTAKVSPAPASPTNHTGATLTVEGIDVTHYQHKVDGGSFSAETPVSAPIILTSLSEGDHTVEVIGRDSVGNWQSNTAPTSVAWTVDTTLPVITGLSSDTTPVKSKTWTWSATDNSLPVTYRYGVDQSDTAVLSGAYGSTTSASQATGDSTYYLHVQAKDAAGNESAVFTVSTAFDNTSPTASITYSKPEPYKMGDMVTITATFSEPLADNPAPRISISGANTLDRSAMVKVDSTLYTCSYKVGPGDGTATVALSDGVDLAGNVMTPSPTSGASFLVDNTPPTASISRAVPTAESTSAATVTYMVSFDEAVTGVTKDNFNVSAAGIAITGASVTSVKPETETNNWMVEVNTGEGDGILGLQMVSSTGVSDAAGNEVSPLPISGETYIIDRTAPEISISASSVQTTRSGPLSFTVTYKDADTITLTSADVSLNSLDDTAQGKVKVTGTDTTTRSITISNIKGEGKLRIKLKSNTASDKAGNQAAESESQPFTVANIKLTLPNGGKAWYAGSAYNIEWSYYGIPDSSHVEIELLVRGKATIIESSVPVGAAGKGFFCWTISPDQTPATYYRIRIKSENDDCLLTDTSNDTFTIKKPEITLVSPDGGENWKSGTTKTITWRYQGNPGSFVKIELLKPGSRVVIAPKAPIGKQGRGSHAWKIPVRQKAGKDYRIRISSTDRRSITDVSDSSFTIRGIARSSAGPDQVARAGAKVKLSGSNSIGLDGAIVSHQWSQMDGPAVKLSDPAALDPTFVAPRIGRGGKTLSFQLTVSGVDGSRSEDTCFVNVTQANIPPTADAGGNQTAMGGELVMLDGGRSTDPDDGIATYHWKQVQGTYVALSDPGDIQPTFVAPETVPGGESLMFQLTVADRGGLKSKDNCIVNIAWVNAPPTARAGEDRTVLPGTVVTLDGSHSTDPDDGIASFQWTQTLGTPVKLSDPSAVSPTFTAPEVRSEREEIRFRLQVTDASGLQHMEDTSVDVVKRIRKRE